MDADRTYYMRRAAQERSAAIRASEAKARDAHLELARRYRARLEASERPVETAAGA